MFGRVLDEAGTLLALPLTERAMKPLPHEYPVGAPAGYATISCPGLPDLTAAPPLDYDGPGDAWSPEHLLLAAVSTCFLFTFRAVARASRVAFLEVDAHTSGTVSKADGVVRFTDIVIHATVTAPKGGDVELLRRAIDKTSAHCLVSASLAVAPRVEATIHAAGAATAPAPRSEPPETTAIDAPAPGRSRTS